MESTGQTSPLSNQLLSSVSPTVSWKAIDLQGVWGEILKKFAHILFLTFAGSITDLCLLVYTSKQDICVHTMEGVPFLTLLHLPLHIRCWVELILWENDAAEHSIARKNYNGIQSGSRCSPDIAYYYSHLHPGPLVRIQIQIQVWHQCLNSLPELKLHLAVWMCFSRWFNDMYTQSLLNKSSSLFLHTHTHLFFSPGHFSLSLSFSLPFCLPIHLSLSQSVSVSVELPLHCGCLGLIGWEVHTTGGRTICWN